MLNRITMRHADVTALAVVDGREPGQAVGVITAADVARVIADGGDVNNLRIYQLMSPNRVDAAALTPGRVIPGQNI